MKLCYVILFNRFIYIFKNNRKKNDYFRHSRNKFYFFEPPNFNIITPTNSKYVTSSIFFFFDLNVLEIIFKKENGLDWFGKRELVYN